MEFPVLTEFDAEHFGVVFVGDPIQILLGYTKRVIMSRDFGRLYEDNINLASCLVRKNRIIVIDGEINRIKSIFEY